MNSDERINNNWMAVMVVDMELGDGLLASGGLEGSEGGSFAHVQSPRLRI